MMAGHVMREMTGRKMRQVIAIVGAVLVGCVAAWLIATNVGTSQAAPADGVPFEKYWDDAGYESLRPSSVTFHIFREDAPDDELGAVTLTAADAVVGEDDHWHGVFAGIPVNDDDGEPIAYVVTEDVPENYIVSYDYGYDGYDITFADGSKSYSTRSMYFGYRDGDGTWWGEHMPSWTAEGYTLPQSDRPVQLDDLVFRVDSTNLLYKQNRHTYVSDSWQTESWGIPNSDLKRMLRVYGTDKIQSMTDWPSGYSVAWEYAANLGRHTPHIRITEYSISWGRNAYSTDYAGLGIRYETSEIRPTRTPGGTIEITDTINLRSFPFTKVWDDEGYEAYRPSSVTVDIYQDGQEQPYATKVIRASDATDDRTWQAAFDDLPRYMTDGTYREHEYTIVERPVDGYEATYDSDYYNGIEFTFGEDTNIKFNTLYSYRGEERGWRSVDHPSNGWAHVAYKDSDGAGQVYAVAQNRRYAVEGTSMYLRYYDIDPYNGDRVPIPEDYEYGISINDVRRIHLDVNAAGIVASPDVVRVITGETPWQTRIRMQEGQHYRITKQEADSDTNGYLYEWDDTRPFPGADTITNHVTPRTEVPFEKYWDDAGYEDRRPSSVTFHLYRQSEPDKELASIVLTPEDAVDGEADHWHGVFGGVVARDGEDISSFIVTEDVPENYIASYDYGYDGYELTFKDGSALPNSTSALSFDLSLGGEVRSSGYVNEYLPYSLNDDEHRQHLSTESGHSYWLYSLEGTFRITSESTGHTSGGTPDLTIVQRKVDDFKSGNDPYWCHRYVIDCIGDRYPESLRGYPIYYYDVWSYKANLGRNIPQLRMLIESPSWGSTTTYSLPIGVAFESIRPVRSPGSTKGIEITDTINLTKHPVSKIWDDEGFEQHRPEKTTVDIYQDDATQPFKTIVLDATNKTDDDTWVSEFTDLPRYHDDYTEYEYTIKERPVSGYDTTYDSEWLDGIEVTFSNETNIRLGFDVESAKLSADKYFRMRGVQYWAYNGLTVTYPGTEVWQYVDDNWPSDVTPKCGITSVRRVHMDDSATHYQTGPIGTNPDSWSWLRSVRSLKDNAFNLANIIDCDDHENHLLGEDATDDTWVHFSLDEANPFPGADTIINRTQWREVTFKKVWDDPKDSTNRPESCTFDLKDGSGQTVKTVTLTADDADPNLHYGDASNPVWTGSFGEWRIRNDDGTPNPYRIVERPVNGYRTLYDSDDEQASIMDVTLRLSGSRSGTAYFDMATNSPRRGGEIGSWSSASDHNPYAEQDEGVLRFSAPAARMLWQLPGVTETEVLSVSRRPGNRYWDNVLVGYLNAGAVNPSATVRDLNQNDGMISSYNKIYASKVGDSWERGEGDLADSYLLYEQTDPFDYCNIIWNVPMPRLLVMKYGEDQTPAIPVNGARLELVDEDTSETVLSWVTSQANAAREVVLPCVGRYAVHEAEPPAGHAFAPDVHLVADGYGGLLRIQDDGSTTSVKPWDPVRIYDHHTDVSIAKVGEDGKALPGCTIQVRGEDSSVIDEFVTGEEPKRYQGVLTGGTTYVLHETSAPAGYALTPDTTFTVGPDATSDNPQTVTLQNSQTVVRVSKIDVTSQEELPGATLQVLDGAGEVVSLDGDELEWTSTSKPKVIEGLPVGTYTLRETVAPTGYAVTADSTFTVATDGSVTYTGTTATDTNGNKILLVEDSQTVVRISKVDITSQEELPGATLQVLDGAGEVVTLEGNRLEWTSTSKPKVIEGLPVGTYTLRETVAPTGYVVTADSTFTIATDGTVTYTGTTATDTNGNKILLVEDSQTIVRVSKVDITNQKELPGATLQILDATGKVVTLDGDELEWTSTSEQRVIEGLPVGSYTLRETVAPTGYAVTADSTFTLAKDGSVTHTGKTATDDDGNETLLVEDAPLCAIVSKKALTGESELPGARITLSEKNGDAIASWTSGSSPHTIDAGLLKHGMTYVIHEEGAPDGYAYAADIEFIAGKDGPTTVVTMRDAPTHVEISKVEVTGGAELPGATLRVLDADGTVIDEWVSTDKPHVIEGTLVAGKAYVLHEEAAPEGHAYAADIEFTVSLDGSIDRVEMVDEVSTPSDEPVTPQGAQASDSQDSDSHDSQGGQGTQAIASDLHETPKGQQGANGQNSSQVASDRVKGTGTLPQMGADALGVMLPAVGIGLSICGIRRTSKTKRRDK